jgi:hypothetical protein
LCDLFVDVCIVLLSIIFNSSILFVLETPDDG